VNSLIEATILVVYFLSCFAARRQSNHRIFVEVGPYLLYMGPPELTWLVIGLANRPNLPVLSVSCDVADLRADDGGSTWPKLVPTVLRINPFSCRIGFNPHQARH
jgi:hypothetical protein